MAKAKPMRCPECQKEQRASYDVVFHAHGVERVCGLCGHSIEIERTDPLRLTQEPGDCPACVANAGCTVEGWLVGMRLDEVRKVSRRSGRAA
ncbi:MAG: hypothetical protein HY329_17425 [Chloroflexi bacterium]|nr:hypothetical protein [Chloroflexota bacterium]